MKKVSAFCHFQQLMGAIQGSGPVVDELRVDHFYFLADYHALIKCDDPQRIQRSRMEIAASWLARIAGRIAPA